MKELSKLPVIDIIKNPGDYSIDIVCRALGEILNKTKMTKEDLSINFS